MESDLTISEIAYEKGYDSISSFSNTFFKMIGQRPSAFRELKETALGGTYHSWLDRYKIEENVAISS